MSTNTEYSEYISISKTSTQEYLQHKDDKDNVIVFFYNKNIKYQEQWYIKKIVYKVIEYYPNQQIKTELFLYKNDLTKKISYFKSGKIKEIIWTKDGEIHYDDGPAILRYDANKQLKEEHWAKNGRLHRGDGPAIIYYNKDGTIKGYIWCFNGAACGIDLIENIKNKKYNPELQDLVKIYISYNKDQYPNEYAALMKTQTVQLFD